MKIFILQSDLLNPLQAVSRSISPKPQLPVLHNILLQTEKDYLKISATNLEVGVIKKVPAEILEEGELTVPAKIFSEIISSLSGERISLEVSGEQLKITTPTFSGVLNGIAANEFPVIPLSSDQSISFPADTLQQSLPQISFSAAIDEARPTLTGIFTHMKDNQLEFVATDGFRLAHKKITLPNSNNHSFKFLIPRRTFEEVVRLISEDIKSGNDNSTVEISTAENQNQMVFQIGTTQLSSRLIEGNYPTWEKIVPTQFIFSIELDRQDLIKAIKLASVFARDAANIVKLELTKDKMEISSESHDLGQQKTELEIKTDKDINESDSKEAFVIAFNNKYLLDALQNCHSKEIKIHFSGSLSSALIRPMEEEGLEYVVMPIRIS